MIKEFKLRPETIGWSYEESSRTDDAVECFKDMKSGLSLDLVELPLLVEGCLLALHDAIEKEEGSARAIYREMKKDIGEALLFVPDLQERSDFEKQMEKIDEIMTAKITLATNIYDNSHLPRETLTPEQMRGLDTAYLLDDFEMDIEDL